MLLSPLLCYHHRVHYILTVTPLDYVPTPPTVVQAGNHLVSHIVRAILYKPHVTAPVNVFIFYVTLSSVVLTCCYSKVTDNATLHAMLS